MLIVMDRSATDEDVGRVVRSAERLGLKPHPIPGAQRTAIGLTGNKGAIGPGAFENLPGVFEVIPVSHPYKLVSREFHPEDTVVSMGGVPIGGGKLAVIAGPCAVESLDQTLAVARAVKEAGASILRGGAFKPRTSPYEFQGLGEKGLKLLDKARRATGLAVITELLSEQHVDLVAEYTDIIQIGTRNAQNFQLLIAAARTGKPILLKRGLAMKIEEWLLAGEYVLANENPNLMFCERGIRSFETYTRNMLDLAAIPIIKQESHLPVVIDPSQGVGRADLVIAMCKGAVAMGADALLIEVHPHPAEAWSDGAQQVTLEQFARLMQELKPFIAAAGRG